MNKLPVFEGNELLVLAYKVTPASAVQTAQPRRIADRWLRVACLSARPQQARRAGIANRIEHIAYEPVPSIRLIGLPENLARKAASSSPANSRISAPSDQSPRTVAHPRACNRNLFPRHTEKLDEGEAEHVIGQDG